MKRRTLLRGLSTLPLMSLKLPAVALPPLEPSLTDQLSQRLQNLEHDLQDEIYMIAPTDNPMMSLAVKGARAELHEWTQDTLKCVEIDGLRQDPPGRNDE